MRSQTPSNSRTAPSKTIEEATQSHRKVKMVTRAMLKDQELIVPVAKLFKKETMKVVDARYVSENRHRMFVGIAYRTGVRSVSLSDRSQTEISDGRTNKKVYLEI